MNYVVVFIAGAVAAASALLIGYYGLVALLWKEKQSLTNWHIRLTSESCNLQRQAEDLENGRRQIEEAARSQAADLDVRKKLFEEDLENKRRQFEDAARSQAADLDVRKKLFEEGLENKRRQFEERIAAFDARAVQYDSLVRENNSLKQDMFNLSVHSKKMDRDQAAIERLQEEVSNRANDLADRYLEENVSWISDKLTSKNFASCKQRLLNVVGACRGIGFAVSDERELLLVENLKKEYEQAVRDEFAREEQARIKAQIREEERLNREVEKQIQDAEREQAAIQAALERALAAAKDEHTAEVERLEAKLKEAQEQSERAKSRAQMTKSGYVYVLSNIGAFGDGVFKIGMTRRLEPMDRVKELGDASVPFAFDVHMMISCNDAPSLENALHRELHKQRLNKVNFRKEFFRADLDAIRQVVQSEHGEVDYVAEPAALEYRESAKMTDEDFEFVEHAAESLVSTQEAPFADD